MRHLVVSGANNCYLNSSMDLFSHAQEENLAQYRPLADKVRPKNLNDFIGHKKYLGPQAAFIASLKRYQSLPSLILWGPPGTGKTTLAFILGREVKAHFTHVNAVDVGAKDLRELGLTAQNRKKMYQEQTLLFIDEIHRLNKSQQDVLLPFTEKGDWILVGATTENPSYELNSALLSRCRVLKLEPLTEEDLGHILALASRKENLDLSQVMSVDAKMALIRSSHGDARSLLNSFENILLNRENDKPLSLEDLEKLQMFKPLPYDKTGEQHYDSISAFIKSVRGSDPNAATYYLARLLEAGEDPVFIARRLVILAAEDIGNADPQGLLLAVAALQAVELVGMPEARIVLSQATIYLSKAQKSNAAYVAIDSAITCVQKTGALPIPLYLRSSQTTLSQNLGYGVGYKYSHDFPDLKPTQEYLPESIRKQKFVPEN